ncbi:MAG: peptide deformylase [Firmicutes bacterium]|nr:peptide deformylase [Bacillota bacterium]
MALRNIVKEGDPVLRKVSRPVKEVNDRIRMILDDMVETMRDAQGVGLAGPQVGILRRLFVIEIPEWDEEGNIVDTTLYELINPEILETSGEQTEEEGCLSCPGLTGTVTRPMHVKIKGLDRNGNEVVYEGEGLTAKAFMHEYDHLDGILYIDKATNVHPIGEDDEEGEEEEEKGE